MHDPLRISLKHDREHAPVTAAAPARRSSRTRRRTRLAMALIIPGVILVGLGYGSYRLFGAAVSHMPAAAADASLSQSDTRAIVAKVGALILLPQNETPTIAVVSDLSKLKGQTFFAHASEGDFVLMYPHAGRAILWDPAQNKIIEVAPIVNDKTPTP